MSQIRYLSGCSVVGLCTDVERKSIETQVHGIFNIFLGVFIEDLSDHVVSKAESVSHQLSIELVSLSSHRLAAVASCERSARRT